MNKILYLLFVIVIFILTKIPFKIAGTGFKHGIINYNTFIDDSGNNISVLRKVNRIISLSPTHTENLYSIGAGNLIIGVDKHSNFPYETTTLEKFQLDRVYDQERIIDLKPDFIISEPTLNNRNRSLIARIESSGIKVISLMPNNLIEFDSYIKKLGIITTNQLEADKRLREFHRELTLIKKNSSIVSEKKSAFIEVSEKGYVTATNNSLIGNVFNYSEVELITPDKKWYNLADEKTLVGLDYILKNNENIDIYFTIKGTGYSAASIESIKQKNDFKELEAIKTGSIYEIPSVLINRYTFRLIDGIKEISRLAYGDKYTPSIDLNNKLTRIDFAAYLYKELNLQTHTIIKSNYYEYKKFSHTYGSFLDVKFTDDDFNIIETVVAKAYLLPIRDSSGNELFKRNSLLTRKELEKFLFIYRDINNKESDEIFLDLNIDNKRWFSGLDMQNILSLIKDKHL